MFSIIFSGFPPPELTIVPGSLTHEEVSLVWNPLRNATYHIIVMFVTEDGSSEILNADTSETNYTITGNVNISSKLYFSQPSSTLEK